MGEVMCRAFRGILLIIATAGCGTGPALVPVEGRVLLDDQPVPAVVVTFSPRGDTHGNGSHGYTDDNGQFTLSNVRGGAGAHVGPYSVTLIASAPKRKEGDALDVIGQGGGARLPGVYMDSNQTQMQATVPEGGGFVEIVLTRSGQGATARFVPKESK
jgi:hypothetical protein